MPAQRAPPGWEQGTRTAVYGSMETKGRDVIFTKAQRQRLNVYAMFQCLMMPWLLFCLIFAVMSFLRGKKPSICWATVGVCSALVLIFAGTAASVLYNKITYLHVREPTWVVFLAISLIAAVCMAVLLGCINFPVYLKPYLDLDGLAHYYAVDPSISTSVELADAGRVEFNESAVLDLRRSMGFKNLDTYCVAPISIRRTDGTLPSLSEYDFWAVGLDCCSGNTADYHCGEYANPSAHGGLRLIDEDQQAFFELAVDQAAATYQLKASSKPLFFYWVEDATAEMNSFRDHGIKYYLIGVMAHFAWQMLCVFLAAMGFARLQ